MKYHGTTTVGLVCTDGIVLSTDTRVTAGFLYIAHRRGKKMYEIDRHVGVTIAGTVADAQNVVDTLRYYANMYRIEQQTPMPIHSVARLAANVFFSQRLFPFIADVLVGGVDREGPNLYSIDFFGSLTKEKMVSTGSGSPVAYGILESEFKNNKPVREVIPIAVKAVVAAMKRNAGTGDSFDVVTITKDGYRELSLEEKAQAAEQIVR
jgi:proteasome beta subunit